MSLRDRILKQNEIDLLFRIQNDRYLCKIRTPDQTVKPMSRIENEIVTAYEEKYANNFKDAEVFNYKLPDDYEPEFLPEKHHITDEEAEEHIKLFEKQIGRNMFDYQDSKEYFEYYRDKLNRNQNYYNEVGESYKDTYERNKAKLEEKINEYTNRMAEAQDNVTKLKEQTREYKNDVKKHNAEAQQIKEHNELEEKKYLELITIFNQDVFPQKRADETEEQYIQRVRVNADMITRDDEKLNALASVRKNFRLRMKELISDLSKIGQVEAGLEPFEQADLKFQILTKWTLFKHNFTKVYGINNPRITASEILEFMKDFLNNKNQIKGVEKTLSYEIDKITNTMTITNNSRDGKELYLRVVMIDSLTFGLVYSFTGEVGSFKQFFDTHIPPNRKKVGKSSEEIENQTGISPLILKKFLGISSLDSNTICQGLIKKYGLKPFDVNDRTKVTAITYQMRGGKEKIEYGMGLKGEDIPRYCVFGDIQILLQKLFHENTLSIRDRNGYQIKGMKPVKVSEQFVRIICNLVKHIYPTQSDINMLKTGEKDVYNHLIHLAKMTKTVPNQKDVSIQNLKKRYKLLEAEIEIGNNSPLIKNELLEILHKLKDFKIITPSQMKTYIKQL